MMLFSFSKQLFTSITRIILGLGFLFHTAHGTVQGGALDPTFGVDERMRK